MKYGEALHWIHTREKFKVKPGLVRMEWMLERLQNPEKSLNAIHVAGTNGKGSTVSFLRNLLEAQGYTVGTFTSPYIIRFNERMSINGLPISDYELIDLVELVKPLVDELRESKIGEPTEFEVITIMAVLFFKQKGVDFALFETGLGGRYDSTNIIHPILSIITNIGKDHTAILGETYKEIAYQKAGIIKKDRPVFTCVKQEDALQVITEEAAKQGAPLSVEGKDFFLKHVAHTSDGESFYFRIDDYSSPLMVTGMKGVHQIYNAGLALGAMEQLRKLGYLVQQDFYADAIQSTTWPARFEIVQKNPAVILDGAHNQEGTEALVQTLKAHFPDRSIYLLYAAVQDKPIEQMLNQLKPIVKEAWFTNFQFPKAMKARDIAEISSINTSYVAEKQEEALQQIMDKLTEEDVLVISGSLYFISDIRKYFE
ncbi:bifunctional folylpolyglutamate synthase/dihydrofolate synthase [Halobacillus andaensis]|uniref:Dihydrofolate synthase/folylpolyglutamate synthase n=1 Tax=Halobacillus andaensis TaxID=1176239 RepID=A0A917AYE8_HALAA|nr:folylpolyglutamate synthase/dihydrofolate synthase family protein [Halobacillus andaensis]MBP2002942.1 dihydrofolate synthase/folylpolyglutamate synthase [Halobacillus andaensis]GGF06777.1 bifunctional folylpolyglutamate synthase/dihydrofolate synthase [Halobacillus andaensis]